MADLTLHTERARYFARRSALIHVVLLVAFTLAGLGLHGGGVRTPEHFVPRFCIGLLARQCSAVALGLQPDSAGEPAAARPDTSQRVREALGRSRFRVAVYVALLGFGTQVAAPFFTPYMLRELGLDYRAFAALSAVSILAKALMFPWCHHLAQRFGLRNLLWCAGIGVAIVPLLWAASPQLGTLVLANAVGGIAWAGLEYSSFQLLLDSAPASVKTEFFSLSSTLTGVGQVTGAFAGGLLLDHHTLAYQQVFVLSAGLRALALAAVFLGLGTSPLRLRVMYTRVLSVRPGAGADQRPIVAEGEKDD